jgi:hypothetical protein
MKRQIRKYARRWEDNIKASVTEVGHEVMSSIYLVQDKEKFCMCCKQNNNAF